MAVKAILFDLDDTLIASSAAYEKALRAVGLSGRALRYARARKAVKKRLGYGHPSARNRLLYFKQLLETSGGFSPDRVLRLTARYETALINILRDDWKRSNLSPALARLSKRYRLAIVSNENTRTQLLKLQVIDPSGRLFSTVVTSEEVGAEKPSRKIFEETFRRLGIVPKNSVMVGDSISADISPMRRLGGAVFHVKKISDILRLEAFLDDHGR